LQQCLHHRIWFECCTLNLVMILYSLKNNTSIETTCSHKQTYMPLGLPWHAPPRNSVRRAHIVVVVERRRRQFAIIVIASLFEF